MALRSCLPFLLGVGVSTAALCQAPEFTRQGLLVTNFTAGPGADLRLGRRAADAVRSRVAKLVNKREIEVISGDLIRLRTDHAGYDPDTTFSLETLNAIGKSFRADEYVDGAVATGRYGTRLSGSIVLMRDRRIRQPLPVMTSPRLDEAADSLARYIAAAQKQLVHERRCENALRDRKGEAAIQSARAGIAAFPGASIARICLGWSLVAVHAPADSILTVADEILAIDSTSFYGMEMAAGALDSLHRHAAAATMWLRVAASDTGDIELATRVILALVAGGNAAAAEPLVIRLSDAHPDEIGLLEQKWHVTYETHNWAKAIEAAQVMLVRDSAVRLDPAFWLRLGTAYQANGMPIRAIETLASAVSAFPNEAKLYALYSQYVKVEADTVLARGLASFPQSAELLALNAKELRGKGKLEESLDASKKALALDSTMTQGDLVIAQLQLELGRPDSALSSLRQALVRGEDTAVVAQFALAKGNTFYRAANATHVSADFSLALRFLAFADTVRSSVQSRFLIGAAALGISQSALTESTKAADKAESCRLARLGADMIPVARNGLTAGIDLYGDAAKQSLDYLSQIEPVVSPQLVAYCGGS
jgi:tetratricopeptide (TPR) repeat protein